MTKKITVFSIALLLIAALFVGCSKELIAEGCDVIDDDGKYVTYQQICEHCGCEFGDPTTAYVSRRLHYSLPCTECGQVFFVNLERK